MGRQLIEDFIIKEKDIDSYLDKLAIDMVDFEINYLMNTKFSLIDRIKGKNSGKGGLIFAEKCGKKEDFRVMLISKFKPRILKDLRNKGSIELDHFMDLKRIGVLESDGKDLHVFIYSV